MYVWFYLFIHLFVLLLLFTTVFTFTCLEYLGPIWKNLIEKWLIICHCFLIVYIFRHMHFFYRYMHFYRLFCSKWITVNVLLDHFLQGLKLGCIQRWSSTTRPQWCFTCFHIQKKLWRTSSCFRGFVVIRLSLL